MYPPNRNIFINCPFDGGYAELFEAMCFAILYCGFVPRSALERIGSVESRLDKICRIIGDCDYGIHDLSATDLSPDTGLPRFNMPFEFGLFTSARRFGGENHARKQMLVLDSEQFRYQKFISDIAGYDIQVHHQQPSEAVTAVRNWLRTMQLQILPAAQTIYKHYQGFRAALTDSHPDLKPGELIFNDFIHYSSSWIDLLRASQIQAARPKPAEA